MSQSMKSFKSLFESDCPVFLAPMAGITDQSFRTLCKEKGADGLVTEMISAKALYYGNRNTRPLLAYTPQEHPIGVQLFGSDPELMADMALRLEDMGFDYIDLNMGCPVPKVVNNGEGSALMRNPCLAGRIVEAIAGKIHIPVTVKFRKGFDGEHINAVEFARVLEQSGADALCVHGRTRDQYYAGKADWEIIKQVKQAVSVPVIGNGDIFTGQDAVRMREFVGCDGVMVGRAAKGNPWLFAKIKAALAGREIPESPSGQEIISMLLRHARMNVEAKGEKIGILEMRKHAAWYTAGMRGSAGIRRKVNMISTYSDLEALFTR